MSFSKLLLLMAACCCSSGILFSGEDTNWIRIRLDERFRSEGSAAADLNNDGTIDVIAGDVWYQAPPHDSPDHSDPAKWVMHEIREPGQFFGAKGYSNSFVNFVQDLNQDGWQDVIIVGFPGDPFHWYRNPGPEGSWIENVIWSSACNESPELEDLDGDGTPELVLASQPQAQLGFVSIRQTDLSTQSFLFHPVNERSTSGGRDNGSYKYSHGLGVGDVNGDGYEDIIIRQGWLESPGNLKNTKLWSYHPFVVQSRGELVEIPDCANIYADDLDLDGDADLVCSSAHKYGVWWHENRGNDHFERHIIDESYSQTHAMETADINGDGQRDYVTGKRFFAHNGSDPGGHDPVVMYWYEVRRTRGQPPTIIPHEIIPGRGTGIGTQFTIRDMNADGRPDIVLSNKKGVNVLLKK